MQQEKNKPNESKRGSKGDKNPHPHAPPPQQRELTALSQYLLNKYRTDSPTDQTQQPVRAPAPAASTNPYPDPTVTGYKGLRVCMYS